jgi:hypothetical protein
MIGGAIGNQPLLVGLVRSRYNDGLADFAVPFQNRLNFLQFNSVSADFYLMVKATQKLEVSIRLQSDRIAGSVQSRTSLFGGQFAGDKSFGGQFWPLPIAAGDSRTANEKFTRSANRYRPPRLIKDVNLRVGYRLANMNASTVSLDFRYRRPNRRLRRPVHVEDSSGPDTAELGGQRLRQGFASNQQLIELT